MQKLIILLITTLLGIPALAGDKRNPYLRLLEKSEGLRAAHWQPALSPWALEQTPPAQIFVLVQRQEPATTAQALRAAGAQVGRALGTILPVWARPAILRELSARPEVLRIEAAPPKQLRLDKSLSDIGADRVQAGTDLPLPVTGAGVLVGLVDTGIDYRHPDFGTERTRVLAIWDQFAASGEPPPGQNIGALCTRSQLLNGSCDSLDIAGHGTHVAATMASSGQKYRGVAPGANIIAVAALDFGPLVASVQWLFEQAQERHEAMVVNLSLGGHYGPHDGSDLETTALSDLTGPGRIIVASAGNEGGDPIHLGYDPQGDTGKTYFSIYAGMDIASALFTVWHAEAGVLSFAVGIEKEGTELAETTMVSAKDAATDGSLTYDSQELGRVYFEPAGAVSPANGKWQLDIVVEPGELAFAENEDGYKWYLKVNGQGSFDAWSAAGGFLTPAALFSTETGEGLVPGDSRKTVGMPSVAPGLISVASYTTRSEWISHEGEAQVRAGAEVGQISRFSSRGPSSDPERTGPKPEFAAPGEVIVAALGEHSIALSPGTQVDELHVAMQGTSMSCPHLAGVVALLLEIDPGLDPDQIRHLLQLSAKTDPATGTELPNDTWGYGKVDAHAAVLTALGLGACLSDADCADDYQCQVNGQCQLIAEEGCACGTSRPGSGAALLGVAYLLLLTRRRR